MQEDTLTVWVTSLDLQGLNSSQGHKVAPLKAPFSWNYNQKDCSDHKISLEK